VLVTFVAFLATAASPSSPYGVDLVADGVATGSFLGLGLLLTEVVEPRLSVGSRCAALPASGHCDPAGLDALDREALGMASAGWRTTSNVALGATFVAVVAADAVDVALHPGAAPARGFATDVLVIGESVALTMLATEVTKLAVRRPRPGQYRDGADQRSVDEQLSFPSGHTSTTAAVATAWAVTFALRHPDSPWRWAAGGGALVATALVGYARIAGGKHFPTDVAAGALLGVGFGLLVPLSHRDGRFVVTPLALPGGSGAALTLAW
jgi:membrane-associated phospholipid phosphatase